MQVAAAAPQVDFKLDGMFVAAAGQPQQALMRLNDDYDNKAVRFAGKMPLRDLNVPTVLPTDDELVSGRFHIDAAGATGQWSLSFSTAIDNLSGGLRVWRKQGNTLTRIDPGALNSIDNAIPARKESPASVRRAYNFGTREQEGFRTESETSPPRAYTTGMP